VPDSGFWSGVKALGNALRTDFEGRRLRAAKPATQGLGAQQRPAGKRADAMRTAPLLIWALAMVLTAGMLVSAWRNDRQRVTFAEASLTDTARKNHALNALAHDHCGARLAGNCGW
jgi:hypothetical protein